MKLSTALKEGNDKSPFSARRLIAMIMVLDSIFNTIFAMINKIEDWHIYLVIMGIPLLVATVLLFCTTLNDVIKLTSHVKRNRFKGEHYGE